MYKNWLKMWLWWTRKRHPDLEHFSDESKTCFTRANQIALENGSNFVNSVHVLQAILETPLGKSIDSNGNLITAINSLESTELTSHSEGVKKALEYSIKHARALGSQEITPLLLLHGISEMQETKGAKLLLSNGITNDKIEAMMLAV